MSDLPELALALVAGAVLGAVFFGGLWWTVRKTISSAQPAPWFIASFFMRTGLILTGFYLVGQGHWSRIVACLTGFLLARVLVVKRLSRATPEPHPEAETEAIHAHQP